MDTSNELHVSIPIPRYVAKQIHQWALNQPFPPETKFEHPTNHHITTLYSLDGHEHKDGNWIKHLDHASVRLNGLHAFPADEKGYAYVLGVDSPELEEHANELQNKARWVGLDVPQYEGGFKPHITVGYGPQGDLPNIESPNWEFDAGPSEVSPKRPVTSATEPQMVFHDLDPRQKMGWWGRWPTVYDPETNTAHVGTEGTTHPALRDAAGLENTPYHGWIGPNPEDPDAPTRWFGSTQVGWYDMGTYHGSPGPHIDYALGTRQWPKHPESDMQEVGGYGHAQHFAMDWYPTEEEKWLIDHGWGNVLPAENDHWPEWGEVPPDEKQHRNLNIGEDWAYNRTGNKGQNAPHTSETLYHVAPTVERDRIRQHGLLPNESVGIWGTPTHDEALTWAQKAEEEGRPSLDIWRLEGQPSHDPNTNTQYIPHRVEDPSLYQSVEDRYIHQYRNPFPDYWEAKPEPLPEIQPGTNPAALLTELRQQGMSDMAAMEWMQQNWPKKTADYYHVAPTEERARIKQHGLQPSKPIHHPRWEDMKDYLGNQPEGVYVTDTGDPKMRGLSDPFGEIRDAWGREPDAWGEALLAQRPYYDIWRIPQDQFTHLKQDEEIPEARIIPHAVYPELAEGGPEEYGPWPRHEEEQYG